MSDEWKVLPHRAIEKLSENLWRVEGDLDNMPLKRVMAIAKREDGSLVVHNAVALEESAMNEIEAWGKVSAILVPNGYHRIDAPRFARRFEGARVYCPEGSREKVEEVVKVDGTYDDFVSDASVSVETLEGTKRGEGVMHIRSKDGVTLIFNDAIFNMPHVPGVQGFVLKHLANSTGGPRVSRIGKMFLVKDKSAFKAHLGKLADTADLKRVIVSHHEMIDAGCGDAIRAAIATV
jgi:hypothetical protein